MISFIKSSSVKSVDAQAAQAAIISALKQVLNF